MIERAASRNSAAARRLCARGDARLRSENYASAYECYAEALRSGEAEGDRGLAALASRGLGRLFRLLGDADRALRYLRRALAQCGRDAGLRGEVLCEIGETHLRKGDPARAAEHLRRGLSLATEMRRDGDGNGSTARSRLRLAQALIELGDHAAAEAETRLGMQTRALDADLHFQLLVIAGVIHERRSRVAEAARCYRNALRFAHTLADPAYAAAVLVLMGDLYRGQRSASRSASWYRKAEATAARAGNRYWEFKACSALASLYDASGSYRQAARHYRRCIELREGSANYIQQSTLEGMRAFWEFGTQENRRLVHERAQLKLERKIALRRADVHTPALELARRRDWRGFEECLEIGDPGFFRCLFAECPSLTATDLRVCALLRLGLASKSIARLLVVTAPSVDTYRVRIRRKLGLAAHTNLAAYLSSL